MDATPERDLRAGGISVELARQLRDAGLAWQPRDGDRFFIPDRGLDDHSFAISDMVVEVRDSIVGRREIAFNGTVEWALDSILKSEVVWLPGEHQLRRLLGPDFIALYAEDEGRIACVARIDGVPRTFVASHAPDAYASALLAMLNPPD